MYVLVAGGGHMGTHLVTRLAAEGTTPPSSTSTAT